MNSTVTAAQAVGFLRQNLQQLLVSTGQQRHEIGIVNSLNMLEAQIGAMQNDINRLKTEVAALLPKP